MNISQQDVETIIQVFEKMLEYYDWDDSKIARIIESKDTRKRMRDVYIKLKDWEEVGYEDSISNE